MSRFQVPKSQNTSPLRAERLIVEGIYFNLNHQRNRTTQVDFTSFGGGYLCGASPTGYPQAYSLSTTSVYIDFKCVEASGFGNPIAILEWMWARSLCSKGDIPFCDQDILTKPTNAHCSLAVVAWS
jgi:hypothetical protein